MNRDTARLFAMLRLHLSFARAGKNVDDNLELAAATVSVLYRTVDAELADCRCGAIRAEERDLRDTLAGFLAETGRL